MATASTASEEPSSTSPKASLDCAVCLNNCLHPAKLDCGHIFCFLCIKGVAVQSKRCPMCRREIRANFLEDPTLIEDDADREKQKRLEEAVKRRQRRRQQKAEQDGDDEDSVPSGESDAKARAGSSSSDSAPSSEGDEVQWFYEGRNGWWQYDERTSAEIEAFYVDDKRTCDLLIAGFLYTVNFEQMVQYRRNDPIRRRRIRRDLVSSVPRKGIAGIRKLQVGGGVDDSGTNSTASTTSVTSASSTTPSSSATAPTSTAPVPSASAVPALSRPRPVSNPPTAAEIDEALAAARIR